MTTLKQLNEIQRACLLEKSRFLDGAAESALLELGSGWKKWFKPDDCEIILDRHDGEYNLSISLEQSRDENYRLQADYYLFYIFYSTKRHLFATGQGCSFSEAWQKFQADLGQKNERCDK